MDNKKALELIKLEAIGCLNKKDAASLLKMKETEKDFPWKILAEYQTLITLLPITLTLNYPDAELKDKTATKLYQVRNEIKAKIDAKKEKEKPVVEKKSVVGEVVLQGDSGGVIIEDEEISLQEDESDQVEISVPEKTVVESRKPSVDKKDSTTKIQPDRDQVEKIAREYFNTYFEKEIKELKNEVKKNRLLSFILFAIAIVLIVVLFVFL